MNEFAESLRSILAPYNYLLPNGEQIPMMKNKEYIAKIKALYIKESAVKIEEFSSRFKEIGILGKDAIDGVVSDVFFSFFQEDI